MKNETLEISKARAVTAYKKAPKELKETLEELLGKENLVEGKITDRIKTFEDVCRELGEDHQDVIDSLSEIEPDEAAYIKLKMIARVLNEGWAPDWDNDQEYKYYPYFDMRSKNGFGFSDSYCDRWRTATTAGSRLCFKTSDLAVYAGKQFVDVYKEFMTI